MTALGTSTGYERIAVAPVTGTLGAHVTGVDASASLDDATVAELRRALVDHHVLFLRDQQLTPAQQVAFGRHFGELDTHPFVEGMAAHPEVIEVITEADDRANFGGGWHTDVTFLEEPDLGSILYAVEVPPVGGDTLFADQHAAYDTLSDTMKGILDGLVGLHSAGPQYAAGGYSIKSRSMRTKEAEGLDGVVEHPVVRTHPESGRKALYVNRAFTIGIKGLRGEESAALLRSSSLTPHGRPSPAGSAGSRAPSPCGTTAACSTTPSTTTRATGATCGASR
jgi:taurine dioxygenase